MALQKTFHRRNLPPPAISFSSPEGRQLFEEALKSGFMEGYFELAQHFTTQGDPSFCGLGSLTMALNSLLLDPQRVWKGVWRWFDESMLDCCSPLEKIKLEGISLPKLGCLARCNGAEATMKHGTEVTLDQFREDIKLVCSLSDSFPRTVMICSYSRRTVHQSGDGHFSPIAGYHPNRDAVLIMDVARFKYPPHWMPLELLYEALQPLDKSTGKSRGYLLLSVSEKARMECCCRPVETETEESAADAPSEPVPLSTLLDHACPNCQRG